MKSVLEDRILLSIWFVVALHRPIRGSPFLFSTTLSNGADLGFILSALLLLSDQEAVAVP